MLSPADRKRYEKVGNEMKFRMLEEAKAPEPEDFTLTIEYTESRQDKLKGRNHFEGRTVASSNSL